MLTLFLGLQHYQCEDDKGRDVGINVRNRSKEIVSLLQDDERIAEERKKARAARDKYTGVSSENGRGFGSSSGRYDSYDSGSNRYDSGSSRYDSYDSGSSRSRYDDECALFMRLT